MPGLEFQITGAGVLPHAAVPGLQFSLQIQNQPAEEQIQAIMLRVQIRIEAPRRGYSESEKARLLELFGEPERWGETVKSLLWSNVTMSVPSFRGECCVELPVPCTYDFEVMGAKYLDAVESGEIPLLFLFSGTTLYANKTGDLQISQIPWEKEATYRMPVTVWRAMIDHYFPNSAWLRLNRDVFDRLCAYKGHNTLLTWEETFNRLLEQADEKEQ